jgi:copper chaperone CopZ
MQEELKCCTNICEVPLNQNYWDERYQLHQTGWDLGQVSPPLKAYFETLQKKNSAVLIPGCGSAYEASFLLSLGFTNITLIDISPTLVHELQLKFEGNSNIKVVLGDFFAHEGTYDFIFEQTFFCALPPFLRQKYVWKMHQLLAQQGKLVGLLFNRSFTESPPFGGSSLEYEGLFRKSFEFVKFETASNSIPARANTELFFEFKKMDNSCVKLYQFQGITCGNCVKTVSEKFLALKGTENVSMSSDFSTMLIVSENEIPLSMLQSEIAYDSDYKITPMF